MTNLLYSTKHYQIKCAKSEEKCKEYAEVLQNLLPNQENNAGKYLTTNGSYAEWGDLDLTNKANSDLSNVTNVAKSFKNQSVAWGIPDYDSTVSINVVKGVNTWTAPIDCFVHVSSQSNGQCTASIASKTNELWYSRVDNTNATAKICSASAFIDKGRTITIQYTGTLNYCYYAPLKGVN